jgi:hypothetical protein
MDGARFSASQCAILVAVNITNEGNHPAAFGPAAFWAAFKSVALAPHYM